MANLPTLPDCLQELFGCRADELAKQTNFIARHRQLSGRDFLTTLVFGYLHDARVTLQTLATQLRLTESALQQHCAKPEAVTFLAAILRAALEYAIPRQRQQQRAFRPPPALRSFAGVYVTDSTCVPLPACLSEWFPGTGHSDATPTATLKIFVTYELCSGRVQTVQLYAGTTSDHQLPWPDLPRGCLHLTDLGFYRQERLRDEHEHGQYWISRLSCNQTLRAADATTNDITKVVPFLRTQGVHQLLDTRVIVGAADHAQPLPARLVAWRVSPSERRRRQRKLRQKLSRKGQRVTPDVLALCGWLVFITNLTNRQLSVTQIGELYRLRWQIELLFKRWKSLLQVDAPSRKRTATTALVEVYARVLGVVVSNWWERHSAGPLAEALTGIVRVWQRWSHALSECLRRGGALRELLTCIAQELSRLPRPRRCSSSRSYTRLRLYFTVNFA